MFCATSVGRRTDSKNKATTPTIFYIHIATSQIKDMQQIWVFFAINLMVGKSKYAFLRNFEHRKWHFFGTFLSKKQPKTAKLSNF